MNVPYEFKINWHYACLVVLYCRVTDTGKLRFYIKLFFYWNKLLDSNVTLSRCFVC